MSRYFALPNNGLEYVGIIFERSLDLIRSGIWSGLDQTELRSWYANFTTDEEKYFAACVLDFMIYRSQDQTVALLKHMFRRAIPDLARRHPAGFFTIDCSDLLSDLSRNNPDTPEIRLVTVAETHDHPTKSAYEIARFMKRYVRLKEDLFIHARQIEAAISNGITNFLFVDDFLGTGDQFEEFIFMEGIEQYLPSIKAAYIPLVAHEEGISKVTAAYPSIIVSAVEVLNEEHSVFSDKCFCFHDEINTPENAKDFFYDLLSKKNIITSGESRKGHGGLELAYGFSHAAPDNSLPILWWHSTESFSPLFKR